MRHAEVTVTVGVEADEPLRDGEVDTVVSRRLGDAFADIEDLDVYVL